MRAESDSQSGETSIDYWYGCTIGYRKVFVAVRGMTTVAVVREYSEEGSSWIEVEPPFDLRDEYEVDPSDVPAWAKNRALDFFYLHDTSVSSLLERTNNDGGEQ